MFIMFSYYSYDVNIIWTYNTVKNNNCTYHIKLKENDTSIFISDLILKLKLYYSSHC